MIVKNPRVLAFIKLLAQEKGKAFLEGESNLRIGGSFLHVEGLVFRNGYTPTGQVISFRINKENLCNNCRVSECVIDNYNPPERFDSDYWGIVGDPVINIEDTHVEKPEGIRSNDDAWSRTHITYNN